MCLKDEIYMGLSLLTSSFPAAEDQQVLGFGKKKNST